MTIRRAVLPALLLAVLATARAEAIPCPGNGAKLRVIINNPTTTTGQQVFISGSVADGLRTCVGQSDTYATTVTLASTGDNTFVIPVAGGLNSGLWMHHISIGDQFQHRRTPVLFTSDPGQYATVRWTYHPTVIQVNKAGDATGSCSGGVCTFRQALNAANALVSTTPAILIQLMLAPGGMTQSADLDVGSPFFSPIITIDGTDAGGNPWIVGDALAAAQGSQSPFLRTIDLRNTTKLRIVGDNVTLRGLAISNTVISGPPTDTLIESVGMSTRIEAVQVDGGSTGACTDCVNAGTDLLLLDGGLAEVINVEGRAAYSSAVRVDFNSSGTTKIQDSWFHHNYGTGIMADGASIERNFIELSGRRFDNVVVNSVDGVGIRRHSASEITTDSNIVRNHTSFGISALAQFDISLAHDAVCGNGDTGLSVELNPSAPRVASGTGLGTMYNFSHGVKFTGSPPNDAIQFNGDSAFTANGSCGFGNLSSVTASAIDNQWRGAVTACADSADVCTGGLFDPITCDPFQDAADSDIVLNSTNPTYPRNAFLIGQTVRVQGTGFNAIAGNPLAAAASCELGSDDVSNENCCRKKTKANVCALTGTPPDPNSNGSNCVAILDATNVWKRLAVTSVTPTTIVTEVPNPAVLCIGEGYTQTVRVAKLSGGILKSDQKDYCRNLP